MERASRTSARVGPLVRDWVPDLFTGLRLALIPVLLWLAEATRSAALTDRTGWRGLTLLTLVAIGASDMLDGWAARRRRAPPGRTGAALDAGADRLFQWCTTVYLTFRAEPGFTALPEWLLATVVLRDVVLAAAWLSVRRRAPAELEHAIHGKAALAAGFAALLASLAQAPPPLVDAIALVAAALMAISTVLHARRLRRTPERMP